MKRTAGWFLVAIVVSFLAAVSPALAQEEEDGEGEGAIPAYAVARVKVVDGSVWVRPSAGGDWEEFLGNSPVPPRSRVSVPDGSEAELQFHGGQFVLLTSGTDLEIRDMKEGSTSFRLRAGEIRFDLPPDDFAPVSVRVPGGARARFPEPGRYWLTVTDGDETVLVVRRGKATVTMDGDEFRLSAGDQATIGRGITVGRYRGGVDDSAPPPASGEEARVDAPPAVVNELREYGEWVYTPSYGYVWRPRVAADWSPYVYGRWVWISPYGWTWVSYEPWGWYPYRCGYWLTDPVFGWIWYPYHSFVSVNFVFGSFRHHHHNVFFRPATVRFIPEGRTVRWVPLRPGERFRPVRFPRDDGRLSRWNRPLESGRVFVRGGPDRREWRDWKAVHVERQVELRRMRAEKPRPDTRTVRPEKRAVRPAPGVEGKRTPNAPEREKALRGRGNRPESKEGREIERRPTRSRERPEAGGKGQSLRPERGTRGSGVPTAAPVPGAGGKGASPPHVAPRPGRDENEEGIAPRLPPSRQEGVRGVPQERTPAVRDPDSGSRGREPRGGRGDDDGGRGGDRGGDRGGGRTR